MQDMLSSGDSMQGNPIWSCLAHVCYGHGTEPAALSWFLPWIKVMSWQCVQTGRNVQERWLRVMSNNPLHGVMPHAARVATHAQNPPPANCISIQASYL